MLQPLGFGVPGDPRLSVILRGLDLPGAEGLSLLDRPIPQVADDAANSEGGSPRK